MASEKAEATDREVSILLTLALPAYCDTGDWHHGFNSGCLATFRLILSAFDNEFEQGKKDFPFLDT